MERLSDAVAIGSAEFARRVRQGTAGADLAEIYGKRDVRRRVPVEEVRWAVERLNGSPWARFSNQYGDWGSALLRG